jgi:hypothetical protein
MRGIPTPLLVAGVVVMFALFGWLAIWADGKDAEECKAAGGKRVTTHTYGTTSDGKSVTFTNTQCVVPPVVVPR